MTSLRLWHLSLVCCLILGPWHFLLAGDWPQILGLYELLLRLIDTPMARLSHAIALAMVHGASAGLARLAGIHHRFPVIQ